MDIREYFENDEEALRTVLDSVRKRLYTALPVRVTADSEDGHTVSLESTIKGQKIGKDGKTEFVDLPGFDKVPIRFASGGGATLTHPVKKGDEGLIIFACRPIDTWHQSGGVQQPVNTRMHDLSDGFYIPGVRSDPRKIEKYSKDSVQLRSDDGKHFVDLHPKNGTITMSVDDGKHVTTVSKDSGISHKSSVAVNIDAPKGTFTMDLKVDGTVHATKAIKSDVGVKAPAIDGAPGTVPDPMV